MFRPVCSYKYVNFILINDSLPNLYMYCVRYNRKPPWLPMAKSKLFRIPERPKADPVEDKELKRLHDRYKTYMRSIRAYFKEEVAKTSANSLTALQGTKEEEEEHARCMKVNEEWNKQVALLREERRSKELEARNEEILQKKIDFAEQQKEQQERIEQIVREEKGRAKYYITPENIDKAIEEALANPVDHNFAIDQEGNIYHGRKTKPSDIPPDKLQKLETQVQG